MVTWTETDRRDLAELFREDDRLRAEREAERAALARKTADEGSEYREDGGNAPLPVLYENAAPSYNENGEPLCFDDAQFDCLAEVLAELRAEWTRDIERIHRQLLNAVVRMVMPGERAEETVYALNDRVARMEQRIERELSDMVERQLSTALTDRVIDLPSGFWKRSRVA